MYKTIFFSFIFFLTACDSYQKVNGVIVDKSTGLPLQGVKVYDKNKTYHTIETDSLGKFEISKISGGLNPEPIVLVIKHDGYTEQELTVKLKNRDTLKISLAKN